MGNQPIQFALIDVIGLERLCGDIFKGLYGNLEYLIPLMMILESPTPAL